jgi:hypothetical protein
MDESLAQEVERFLRQLSASARLAYETGASLDLVKVWRRSLDLANSIGGKDEQGQGQSTKDI